MNAERFARTIVAGALGLCLAVAVSVARGDEAPAAHAEPQVDPEAERVLRAAADYFRGLDSFRVAVAEETDFEMEGMRDRIVSEHELSMRRPDKFAQIPRDEEDSTILFEGQQVYTYMPWANRYTVADVPAGLADLRDGDLADREFAGGWLRAVEIVLADDPYRALLGRIRAAEYVGLEDLDGTRHHRLRVRAPDDGWQEMDIEIAWDVWIDAGDRPLPRRFVPDVAAAIEQARERIGEEGMAHEGMALLFGDDVRIEMEIRFADWEPNAEFDADHFAFDPPEGAEEVGSIREAYEVFVAEMGAGGGDPDALLGEAAPDFELELLDGGEVRLADHRDRDIVILDFWATWCGPCIRAMPALLEVAEAYADRNVVLYAVNLREPPETIRPMLERQGWDDLAVPVDADGAVGDAYGAHAIPHTVIVDKRGIVQDVHVGFSPNLAEQLSEKLDALLAGQDLAAERLRGREEPEP